MEPSEQRPTLTKGEVQTFFAPAGRATEEELLIQTERLKANKIVLNLLDTVPGPAIVLNGMRQIVHANSSFLSLVRAGTISEVLGKRPGEAVGCIHAFEGPDGCGTSEACEYCGAVQSILACSKSELPIREECQISVGEEHDLGALDLSVVSRSLTIDDEEFIFCCIQDVSAVKRKQVLERIFFHDLLNAVGGLHGMADLVKEYLPAENEEGLETASILSTLAYDLVQEIRDHRQLLQAEEGRLEPSPTPISPHDLVASIVSAYRSHEVGQGKTTEMTEMPEVILESDLNLLRRVIGNMVKNALEATPEGGQVTISGHADDFSTVFEVNNPGTIDRKTRFSIFKRSFSTKGQGRGLGTYSMKLLGEKYLGGHVGFHCDEELGTTFFIRLPLAWPGESSPDEKI